MAPNHKRPLEPRDQYMKRNDEQYFITSHSKASNDKIVQEVNTNFTWINVKTIENDNKLGLSWAKLSSSCD